DILSSQSETTRVKADYATLHEFYWGEARRLQMLLDVTDHRRQDDLRGVISEHELEKRVLQVEFSELRSQVDSLLLTSQDRHRTCRLDVPRLVNFLNRNQTRVNDNWGRLHSFVMSSRSTLIAVTAVDAPFAQTVPFTALPEGYSDGDTKDNSGVQGGDVWGGHIQSGDNTIDLTQPYSASSGPPSRKTTPSKKQRRRESALRVRESPHLRSPGWKATNDGARSPTDMLMFSEAHVHDMMNNERVVWDTLRHDGAIAMLSEDFMVHNLFPPPALAVMLTSMMFCYRLDESLWFKYVPERLYLRAELLFADAYSEGIRPEFWPDLVDADVCDAQDDASSEHDDLQRDTILKKTSTFRMTTMLKVETLSATATNTPPLCNRAGTLCRKSPLARIDSGALTVAASYIVEVPGPGVSSWRHYGILTTFAPSSAHAVRQTAFFFDSAPNKQRFILGDVPALLATELWTHMFVTRVQCLVKHSHNGLTPRARMALDKCIRFMEEKAAGFWYGDHWFAIDSSTAGGADMQRGCKHQSDALTRTVEASSASASPRMCYWILMDPRSFRDHGSPYSLAEQLGNLDRRGPARLQWATTTLDEELVDHIPKSVPVSLLPQFARQDNPLMIEVVSYIVVTVT
ncbi:hypothetical protein PHMEG_00011970, partial [Phytophthora megakarya]